MSDMPDFDSMSPEQLMEWMESLAKRQGADTSTLVTKADMQVAEVDESQVDVASLGEYIPHGWTKERWEEQLAKEAAEKAAKQTTTPTAPPQPAVAPPPPPPPAPVPVAAAPAPATDAAPDFDNMTPEQMMEWMESLAKRQGADTSTLLTKADMQVAEVDESTVDMASLGEYIPHGWTKERWEEQKAKEAAEKAAKQTTPATPTARPAAPPPQPEPLPVMDLPPLPTFEDESTVLATPAVDDSLSWLENLASGQPAEMPDFSALGTGDDPLAAFAGGVAAESGDPLAWLEGLAGDSQPAPLDLSELEQVNNIAALTPAEAVTSPIDTGDDPLAWLETLAKRQGAEDEELATAANLDIPLPATAGVDGPGYKDYSFESPEEGMTLEPSLEGIFGGDNEDDMTTGDAEAWLESLASGAPILDDEDDGLSYEEEAATDETFGADVSEKLKSGTATPEDIASFFDQAFEKAATVPEEEEAVDPNAPAVPAELPDWLMEQMQVPVEPEPPAPEISPEAAAFLNAIETSPASSVPDWLQGEAVEASMTDIFDESAEVPKIDTSEMQAMMEESGDSWVEAFYEESQLEPDEVPDWYKERLSQEGVPISVSISEEALSKIEPEPEPPAPPPPPAPVVQAAPPPAPKSAFTTVQEVSLPLETELPAGEPEELPDWLRDVSPAATAAPMPSAAAFLDDVHTSAEVMPDWLAASEEEAAIVGDMPNWLTDDLDTPAPTETMPDWLADTAVPQSDVPSWLLDTLGDESPAVEAPQVFAPAPPPPPAVVMSPVPSAPISPEPVPQTAVHIDVAATLQAGRSKLGGGDVDAAMPDYEALVRANLQLDAVTGDLSKLLNDERYKKNPAPYRVLGDALMRQGKLQAALDTYRKALNLL